MDERGEALLELVLGGGAVLEGGEGGRALLVLPEAVEEALVLEGLLVVD